MVWPIIAIVISLLAFVVAGYFYQWVKKLPTAGAEIERIGKLIRDGAFTFLRREYRTLLIFCGAVSVIILLLFPNPVWTGMGLGANRKTPCACHSISRQPTMSGSRLLPNCSRSPRASG